MTLIAPTLQAWFTDRLARQLQASPRTIASYRDTLRLLLGYVHETTGTQPSALDWDDLDEPLISRFLDYLETDRHNSPRTRNLRLTAIRSLFKYAALRHPEHAAVIQRCSRSHPNALRNAPSATSPAMRPARSSRRPTVIAGKGAATTPCSPSPSTPACASPS
jgi:site-specific recombinase XerD